MTSIFTDSGQILEDFAERMDVCCPMCHRRACVMRIPADEKELLSGRGSPRFHRTFSARKFSCLHCGSTRRWQGSVQRRGGPYDWYFRFPLWLQTPCSGEILWAFNEDHMHFLEQYVLAKQRIKFHEEGRVRNGTLVSRLPIWIKRAKKREEVTKGILRLKKGTGGIMIISSTNTIFCVHRDLLSTNTSHINQKDSLYYSHVSIEKYT